ncbi:MAG: type IV pilus secretin PilQ [Candidatus Aminicenantes bacterium]|nr:type IV pilus secretin PilQ [Candidatus Aminicenantes bacterium]
MRKTILYLLLILLGTGFIFAGGKFVTLKKSFTNGKEIVELQGDSVLSLPNFYPSANDPRLVVLEFEGIDGKAILGEHRFDKGVVNSLMATQEKGVLKIEIRFKELKPFSIYSKGNSIVLEVESSTDTLLSKKVEKPAGTGISILRDVSLINENGRLAVKLYFRGEVPSYRAFILKKDPAHGKPIRLVVDLMGAKTRTKTKIIGKEGVSRIRVAQFKPDVARVVFDMEKIPNYVIDKSANGLLVKFGEKAVSTKALETSKVTSTSKARAGNTTPSGSVTPKVSQNDKPVTKSQQVGKSNPASSRTVKRDLTKKKTATTSAPVPEPQSQQKVRGTFSTITIGGGEKKYYGEKYTFRFKDADVRDVVRFIAKLASLNVIFDPGVSGKVTAELVDIPWDQALDLILRTNKLGYIIEGNVLRVAPLQVLAQEEEQRRKMRESALPLKTITRTLSYAEAKNVRSIVSKHLSPRGQIVVDDRTNTLIIKDIPDNLEIIDRLIDTLDTPIPQVSIEARIVEVNTNYTRNLGIQWGFMGYANPYYGNQTNLVFPNKVLVDGTPIEGANIGGLTNPLNGYAINIPAPSFNSAIGISLGNVTDSFGLDIGLTAMEQEGYGRILSAPKISTQDNHEASIIQGRQIPIQSVVNNTIMVRYVNAALELRVTPHITAEGTIIMKLNIINNTADFAHIVPPGNVPIITQSASTVLMVKDGETAAIGGLYRIEDNTTVNKTPFLSSIPVLGKILFRGSSITRENRELLIFITPRIIKR